MLVPIVLSVLCVISTHAAPRQLPISAQFVRPLSPEDAAFLSQWTEESKDNIWERSGQFEGDIVVMPENFNGERNESLRWPDRTIPYKFHDKDQYTKEQREYIEETLKLFAKLTCITARPKKSSDEDYVVIAADTGCHSPVGRHGGAQYLSLEPNDPGHGCLKNGTILHEFLHALGFHHQHSSTERDAYVTIKWDNIKDGKEDNFKKYGSDRITNFGVSYDYGSILHYSAYGFSKNGHKTIKPKRPGVEIGQRIEMSEKDILKLEKMYGCA